MIRFVRAFCWFRWRLMINTVKGGSRRDAVQRVARVLALVLPGIIWLLFALASLVTAVAGFALGRMVATGSIEPATAFAPSRILLVLVCAAVAMVPLGRSIHGISSNATRFLLLPVTRRTLHAVEVMSGLSDPWLAFVIPGLATFPIGLISAGRFGAALWGLALGAGLLAVLASLSSMLTFFVHWVLRDRRRAELAAIVGVAILSSSGILAGLWSHTGEDRSDRERGVKVDLSELEVPGWTRVIPSELYAHSFRSMYEAGAIPATAGMAGLLMEAAVLFSISTMIHRVTLESPEVTRSRRRRGKRRGAWRGFPGLSPASGAVASVHMRLWIRTVRGKLSVFLIGPMLLMMGLLFGRLMDRLPFAGGMGDRGVMLLAVGSVFSLLTLQPIVFNQFATDRAGLTLQFLVPLSGKDVVRGTAVAGGVLYGVTLLFCLAAALIVAPGGSVFSWGSTLLGGISMYVLMAPFAAMLSAVFPKAADLGKIGSAGNAHGAAGLIGTILIIPAAAAPGLINTVIGSLLGLHAVAFGLMVLWTIVACGIAVALLNVAARVVESSRENLALVARERS